jgi:hypothetical protein
VTVHEYRIRALYHFAALAVTCIFNTNAAWAAPWTQHISQNSWSQVVEKPLVFQNPILKYIKIPSVSHIPEVFQDSTTGQSTAKREMLWLNELQLAVQTDGTVLFPTWQKSESCRTYDLWYPWRIHVWYIW